MNINILIITPEISMFGRRRKRRWSFNVLQPQGTEWWWYALVSTVASVADISESVKGTKYF